MAYAMWFCRSREMDKLEFEGICKNPHIGEIQTFDEVFLFDRAQEDAGHRYYHRDAVEQERRELLKGPEAELPGTLILSVTVVAPGLRVRQPVWVALDKSEMAQ